MAGELYLFGTGGKFIQAGADVGIFFRQAAARSRRHDEIVEIPLLEASHRGVAGAVKVENRRFRSGLEDAVQFTQAAGDIWDVAQAVADGAGVKISVSEGQIEGVCFYPVNGSGGIEPGERALPSDRQQLRRKIHPVHRPSWPRCLRQQYGQVPAAAAQVQAHVPRMGIAPLHGHLLPDAVLAQTQPIVQLVVNRSNAVKDGFNGAVSHGLWGIGHGIKSRQSAGAVDGERHLLGG